MLSVIMCAQALEHKGETREWGKAGGSGQICWGGLAAQFLKLLPWSLSVSRLIFPGAFQLVRSLCEDALVGCCCVHQFGLGLELLDVV